MWMPLLRSYDPAHLVRVERQGVRTCLDERCHDHIDGNIEPTHDKWDDTSFWRHIDPTIHDELSCIRIKDEYVEVHEWTVLQGYATEDGLCHCHKTPEGYDTDTVPDTTPREGMGQQRIPL